jgi:hypothetical protein
MSSSNRFSFIRVVSSPKARSLFYFRSLIAVIVVIDTGFAGFAGRLVAIPFELTKIEGG